MVLNTSSFGIIFYISFFSLAVNSDICYRDGIQNMKHKNRGNPQKKGN